MLETGRPSAGHPQTIEVRRNDHVRFQIENKSLMPHPTHLHGRFFRVENRAVRGPIKATVLVKIKVRLAIELVANNPGD